MLLKELRCTVDLVKQDGEARVLHREHRDVIKDIMKDYDISIVYDNDFPNSLFLKTNGITFHVLTKNSADMSLMISDTLFLISSYEHSKNCLRIL